MTQLQTNPINANGIELHSKADFDGMRAAGKLAAQTLDMITDHVVPGVTTEELNQLCHDFIVENNAVPAPLNYKGFPKSICTSINHVVCHGIPDEKPLLDILVVRYKRSPMKTVLASCVIFAVMALGVVFTPRLPLFIFTTLPMITPS